MKNTTKYYRVVKNKNYSVISNDFIRRKDLSWKAKGILTYILTLPDDWKINLNEITTHATDGDKSFRSGWKELETAGYIKRYPVRNGQRISHWETIIRESVDIEPSAELSGFVDVQNVDVQNPSKPIELPSGGSFFVHKLGKKKLHIFVFNACIVLNCSI